MFNNTQYKFLKNELELAFKKLTKAKFYNK